MNQETSGWINRQTARKAAAVAFGVVTLGIAPAVQEARKIRSLVALAKSSVDSQDIPNINGTYGEHYDGEPFELVLAGDSLLSGRGATDMAHSSPVLLAQRLADKLQRPVNLTHVARTAHKARDLPRQASDIEKALDGKKPDLVFITMGSIDVKDGTSWIDARTQYRDFVYDMNRLGAPVAWATPPPMEAPPVIANTALGRTVVRHKSQAWGTKQEQLFAGLNGSGHKVYVIPFRKTLSDFAKHPEYFGGPNSDGDQFHPNNMGQDQAVELTLTELLLAIDTFADHPAHPYLDTWQPSNRGEPNATKKLSPS